VRLPTIDYQQRQRNWLKHILQNYDHKILALIFFNAINKGYTPIIIAVSNVTFRNQYKLPPEKRQAISALIMLPQILRLGMAFLTEVAPINGQG
jgi:hypothetical protein